MVSLFTFHDGPPLNLWERCSLQSFADFGHEIVLFSYSKLDVPSSVRCASAADIISAKDYSDFMASAPDQFAQFSDWFRYELLYRHGNWWVDTDVVCCTPSLPEDDLVFARLKKSWLNNGVIKFPAGHAMLAEAVEYCRSHWHDVGKSHRSLLGPVLLTELVTKYNVSDRAWEPSLLYPVRDRQHVWKLGDPDAYDQIASLVKNCPVIHWWQWRFRAAGVPRNHLPPKGSFLSHRFLRHGGSGHVHLGFEQYRAMEASRLDQPQSLPVEGLRMRSWSNRLLRRLRAKLT
jgi:hypothetical protein